MKYWLPERGVKNLKKWMISFMDNPYQITEQVRFWHGKGSSLKYVLRKSSIKSLETMPFAVLKYVFLK